MTNSVPPGVDGQALELFSSSHPDHKDDWASFHGIRRYTNVFIWNKETGKILLGYKKRGFGVNLFNGFGGKVEPGETAVEGALRELKEEAGIEADLTHVGTLFYYDRDVPWGQHVDIFGASAFVGIPSESDEMRPQWFKLPDDFLSDASKSSTKGLPSFPFDKMWSDARLWIPIMLSGKRFVGRVDFVDVTRVADSPEKVEMAKWWFGTVD